MSFIQSVTLIYITRIKPRNKTQVNRGVSIFLIHFTFDGMNKVVLQDMGESHYKEVWDYQENLLQENVTAKTHQQQPVNYLLFTEHYPVYTLGKNGKPENVLISEEQRLQRGVE